MKQYQYFLLDKVIELRAVLNLKLDEWTCPPFHTYL
jgi:hypothetical protein